MLTGSGSNRKSVFQSPRPHATLPFAPQRFSSQTFSSCLMPARTKDLRTILWLFRNLESGLLPICLSCKKIQDQRGNWQPFEYYVRAHSEAKVTHKICPDCSRAISA